MIWSKGWHAIAPLIVLAPFACASSGAPKAAAKRVVDVAVARDGQCRSAADCKTPRNTCLRPVCQHGKCSSLPAPAGARCNAYGSGFCDVAGRCVECLKTADCPPRHRCDAQTKLCRSFECIAARNLSWTRRFSAKGIPDISAMALAPDGSLVVFGRFGHLTLRTDPSKRNSSSLVSQGGADIFVAKFDPAGRLLWRNQFGAKGDQYSDDLAVDRDGNIIITGQFSGDFSLGGPPLSNGGEVDIYLAKLDPEGKHLWSRSFGGPGKQDEPRVGVDSLGNVVLSGYFYQTVDLGGGRLTSHDGNSFLARFTPQGQHLFSFSFGGGGPDVRAVAIDRSDNIIIMGMSSAPLHFKGGKRLEKIGGRDIYLAKFTPTGQHLWSRRFGESPREHQRPQSFAVDPSGSVALAGRFMQRLDFGGGALTTKVDESMGFMALFDSEGKHLFSRSLEVIDASELHLRVAEWGRFFLSGSFPKKVDLGGGELGFASSVGKFRGKNGSEWPLTSFVGKLNPQGGHLWSTAFGRAGDIISAMIVDRCGQMILAGRNHWMRPENLFVARLAYRPERIMPPAM